MINRPVEEPDRSLTLKLTAHEMDMLTWLAQKAGIQSPTVNSEYSGLLSNFGDWDFRPARNLETTLHE